MIIWQIVVGAFIVMEWVAGITLEEKVKDISFGNNKRRYLFKQLVDALSYLHSIIQLVLFDLVRYMHTQNVAHMGVYLNNIMISSGQNTRLVLFDFGGSCNVTQLR